MCGCYVYIHPLLTYNIEKRGINSLKFVLLVVYGLPTPTIIRTNVAYTKAKRSAQIAMLLNSIENVTGKKTIHNANVNRYEFASIQYKQRRMYKK